MRDFAVPESNLYSSKEKLKTAIIGGGHGCKAILELVTEGRMSTFNLDIVCVVDPNSNSVGVLYAKELGIPTISLMEDILHFQGLELVIELTGRNKILSEIYRFVPPGIKIVDHTIARVFWDLNEADQSLRRQLEEKVKLEKQLKWDKKQQQDIINSLGDVIIVMNQDLIIETVNAEFIKVTGVTADQVVGQECCGLVCEKLGLKQEHNYSCRVRELIKTGAPGLEIHAGKAQDGEETYYEVSVIPVFDEAGRVRRVVETFHRITEKVQLKRETQEASQRFQQFIDSTHDLIFIKDKDGRYLLISPSAAALFNRTPEDFIGKTDQDLFGNKIAELFSRKDREVTESGNHICYEETLVLNSKRYHLNTVRFPLLNYKGDGIGVCVISRDISEQKRLQDNLMQSEKLAALGKLAAGVAHEINNPLSGILAFVEDLLVDVAPDDPVKNDYEVIRREALRCRQIVKDLLDYTRLQKPVRRPEDINAIVKRVVGIVSKQIAFRNIEFDLELGTNIKKTNIDPGQLQQVILNLVINAADAMKGAGTIKICFSYRERTREIALTISDQGCGIKPEALEKIFEPFFSTKGQQGNGLGLPVVLSIVEQHGGKVDVETECGKGTSFRIVLPAYEEK